MLSVDHKVVELKSEPLPREYKYNLHTYLYLLFAVFLEITDRLFQIRQSNWSGSEL